jgi:hypothetical protein
MPATTMKVAVARPNSAGIEFAVFSVFSGMSLKFGIIPPSEKWKKPVLWVKSLMSP